jgi:hypothetical protein
LTTLSALSTAFKSGGAMSASAHVLSAGKTAVTGMAARVRAGGAGVRTVRVLISKATAAADNALLGRGGPVTELWLGARTVVHRMNGGRLTPQGDLIVKRWTPAHDVGPLGDGYPANTFRTSSYDEVIIRHDTTMYRVLNDSSTRTGKFWTREVPVGPLQAQLDSALLPEWHVTNFPGGMRTEPQATHYVEAVVPRGQRVHEGPAGPQVGDKIGHSHLDGGGGQVWLSQMNPKTTWIRPGEHLLTPPSRGDTTEPP